jgi:hypothetical protein
MSGSPTQRGVVFWPVGTGDSSTIVIDEDVVVQVDLNDMAQADDDETPMVPVVDRLVECLPTGDDGRPYLAAFVLTHADLDHCRGFEDLLSEVTIGELWATPRLWRDLLDDGVTLSESARAFVEEADRRVAATLDAVADGGEPVSGDRVLIIGHDIDSDDHAYGALPARYRIGPGRAVTRADERDCTGRFEAFLHAPFKDDCAKPRNETSVAMQVTLTDADGTGRFLLFGDLSYETIKKVFDYSTAAGRQDRLAWDVLLAPHHCSKHAVYVGDEEKRDLLDQLEDNARAGATVVSSSHAFRELDEAGDNPPHLIARDRYEEIADAFVCTMEHGSQTAPSAVVFEVDSQGLSLLDPAVVAASARGAVEKAIAVRSGRLGAVAAQAARYAEDRAAARPAERAGRRTSSGTDRIAGAVASDRGEAAAPSTVVGFGQR